MTSEPLTDTDTSVLADNDLNDAGSPIIEDSIPASSQQLISDSNPEQIEVFLEKDDSEPPMAEPLLSADHDVKVSLLGHGGRRQSQRRDSSSNGMTDQSTPTYSRSGREIHYTGPGYTNPAPPWQNNSTTRLSPNARTFRSQTMLINSKIRHLKKKDGEPLWRQDIQYAFLTALFHDETKAFTNSYDGTKNHTYAEIYIDAMARSSKSSRVLREKLLGNRQAGLNIAMVCLLVNIGRMNTTLNCTFHS